MEQDLIDVVEPYVYSHIRTRIITLEQINRLPLKKGVNVLVIATKSAAVKSGAFPDFKEAVEKTGASVILSELVVEENPSLQTIEKIAALYKPKNISLVAGIGGGSALDAAKAVALALKDNLLKNIPVDKLAYTPILLIPTTSGTGSEVTKYSIVTDHSTTPPTKKSIPDHVYATYIIMNPKYLQSQSEAMLAATAIDAASHAIEGILSINSSPQIDLMAYESVTLSGDVLRTLYLGSPRTDEFWVKMMAASVLAGLVINYTGTSLPHGCSYALTTEHGIAHGRALGLTYGAYLRLCDEQKVTRILNLMNLKSIDELDVLFKSLLTRDVNIQYPTEEQIRDMASRVMNEGKTKQHPSSVTVDDIVNMYKNILPK